MATGKFWLMLVKVRQLKSLLFGYLCHMMLKQINFMLADVC